MSNYYLVEYITQDGGYDYDSFCAEDQFEAIEVFKRHFPKCEPYNIFLQLDQWKKEEQE